MQEEQIKRGPGRPRSGQGKQHVDWTISREVLDALRFETRNQSDFVDKWLREHPAIKERLRCAKPVEIGEYKNGL